MHYYYGVAWGNGALTVGFSNKSDTHLNRLLLRKVRKVTTFPETSQFVFNKPAVFFKEKEEIIPNY